jgi:hypothetical protein
MLFPIRHTTPDRSFSSKGKEFFLLTGKTSETGGDYNKSRRGVYSEKLSGRSLFLLTQG